MKSLLVYLNKYKKECVLAPLFKMLEASFELFIPLVVATMIDKGMAVGDKSYIYKSCGILVILAIVGLASAITAQFFAAKAAVGFATGVRRDLFGHLLSLSFAEYDKLGKSTMITRMTSDVMQTQTGVNMFLRLTLRSPFVVFGAMIMAFTIDVKSALVFAIVILTLSAVVAFIMKTNIPLLKKVQAGLDKVLLLTRENLLGVRVLRAFSKEEDEKKSFNDANSELYARQLIAARVSSLMNPVTYVLINVAIVCLIYIGAIRVNNGAISQGQVVALYNYMSQILVELIKLANMIVTLNKALASADRIESVLAITNSQTVGANQHLSVDNNESSSDYIVDFSNVCFKYHEGGDEALSGIDIKVKKGEIIGIIGGTGAGKSTLASLIPGFYNATSGCVKVFGRDITHSDLDDIRKNIGYVFQKASLFKGTIADNLRLGKEDATEEEMLEAMHLAVADDVLKAKGGLEAEVLESGGGLSGGQRQRITIARALIRKPKILILDDSTSALDFVTQATFLNNLNQLSFDTTVFIISQRTGAVMGADRIYLLEDGALTASGTHEELLNNSDTYREIHNTQFGDDADVREVVANE